MNLVCHRAETARGPTRQNESKLAGEMLEYSFRRVQELNFIIFVEFFKMLVFCLFRKIIIFIIRWEKILPLNYLSWVLSILIRVKTLSP